MSEPSRPFPPPEAERKIRFHLHQWIGVPLVLLAPPLLAVVGVFGEKVETVTEASGALSVTVKYPVRLRYRQHGEIAVDLGASAHDSVEIALDHGYAEAFTDLRATPDFASPFRVAAGPDARRVVIELRAERYGGHRGALTVRSGASAIRVPLSTTIFP